MNDPSQTYAANMQAFMQAYAQAANIANDYVLRSYPMREVDVNEPVYVQLASRSFDAGHTETLESFIANLREEASDAPPGVEVMIEITSGYGYDDERGEPEYEVGYWRDPTPEERAEREEHNRKAREHNARLEEREAEQERAEFERLKAKFEG
jgi:hypothetical protein